VQELDFEVGRVLKKLDELGLSNDTLVIFGSDNGAPESSTGPSNGSLRGGKWTNFEGGIRTPCLMRWPNRIPAGSACDAISGIWDLLPTFCEMAAVKVPSDRVLDGVSLLPMMLQTKDTKPPHEDIIMMNSTIRVGEWKLYLKQQNPGGKSANRSGSERQPAAAGSLFNLKTDLGETKNAAAENPEIAKSLRARAETFQKDLAAHSRPIGRLDDLNKLKPNSKDPVSDK
jgi:arylsulfatase A-like enzyme